MAVSIKIHESTKRRLEKLQADLASLGGQDLSLQEILDLAVQLAVDEPANILGAAGSVRLPMSAAARKRVLNRTFDWGGPTSEEDISTTLTSDDAIHGRALLQRSRGAPKS